ncbi:MAG: site-specific integrase [Methanobacteriaceae archaeon]|nr:site-specific integrase [Methanobacteriaceae archaeon]
MVSSCNKISSIPIVLCRILFYPLKLIFTTMNIEDDPCIKDFFRSRGLKESTQTRYTFDFKKYSEFTGRTRLKKWKQEGIKVNEEFMTFYLLPLSYLIKEAEDEEDAGIRMRRRSIREHLLGFQEYLISKDYSPNYIKRTVVGIKTFYREFEIEIPQTRTKVKEDKIDQIEDIPSLDHIKKAVDIANIKYKTIILLMASSGLGSSEVRSITLKDFALATQDYHDIDLNEEFNLTELIKQLKKHRSIIPTWHIERIKTGNKYYTFSSPESTEAIINYLTMERNQQLLVPTNLHDYLFPGKKGKYDKQNFPQKFSEINDKYGWGWKGRRRFFHPHSLRMFFATTLEASRMPHLIIRWMLGHRIDNTTSAYFKPNPEHLKQEYHRIVNKLSISKVEVHDIKSKEFLKIEKDLEANKKESEKQKKELEEVKEALLNIISNEKFQKDLKQVKKH